jgi:hypothetical protein
LGGIFTSVIASKISPMLNNLVTNIQLLSARRTANYVERSTSDFTKQVTAQRDKIDAKDQKQELDYGIDNAKARKKLTLNSGHMTDFEKEQAKT